MYKYLSACYDEFMAEVDYDSWAKRITYCLENRKKGIDCGCGSGKITSRLKKAGYDVIGTDVSAEMLEAARANFIRENLDIPLVQMDSEKLTVGNKIEFITAVCDVVNYIKKPERFFRSAYRALKPGGILIFDISSKFKLTGIIGNNVFTDSTDNVTYIWSNVLSPALDKVEMYLTFFTKNATGSYDKSEEKQVQYIYDPEYLVSLLRQTGFENIKYVGFDGKGRMEEEERIFFTAYKV